MIIAWTSDNKARERNPLLYFDQSFIMTYHTGSGGAMAAVAVTIKEVPEDWGITDPNIARAIREVSDRVNRLIYALDAILNE